MTFMQASASRQMLTASTNRVFQLMGDCESRRDMFFSTAKPFLKTRPATNDKLGEFYISNALITNLE